MGIGGLWLVGVMFLPWLPAIGHFSVFDDRRLFLVFLLVMTGFSYLGSRATHLARSPISWAAVVLFLLLGLISSVQSPVFGYAVLEWATFLLVFASVWVMSEVPASAFRSGLLVAVSLSAVLYVLMTLLRVFFAHLQAQPLPLDSALLNNFINLRYFNQWLSWLLPLLPAASYLLVPRCRTAFWRVALFLALAFLWGLLFHSGGRGTLFAIIGAAIVLLVVFGRSSHLWLTWQLAAALVGSGLAVWILGATWPWEIGGGAQTNVWSINDAGRLPLWRASFVLITDHPWLGIGPMQYAALQFDAPAHPHSFPLQIAVEWGVPAALLLLSLLAWMGVSWGLFARSRVKGEKASTREKIFLVGLTGSLLTAGAHSLVSGVIVTPMSLVMLVVLVGAAVGQYRAGQDGFDEKWRPPVAGRVADLSVRAVVLPAALYAGAFTLIEAGNHQYNWDVGGDAAWGSYAPRFWHQGKLVHHLDEQWLFFSIDGQPLPMVDESTRQ